jgi:class 3 adenylate cyclase
LSAQHNGWVSIPPETRYARNGAILDSRTIRDLVAGAPVRLDSRGEHELKGVPGSWEVFAVTS